MSFIKIGFISFILYSPFALAQTYKVKNLSIEQSQQGIALDIEFAQNGSLQNLKPTHERNFIQFVLSPVQMESARIIPVHHPVIQKIFAYPYSATTSRVRFILNRPSKASKDKVVVSAKGKNGIRIYFQNPSLALETAKKAPEKQERELKELAEEERQVLQKVIHKSEEDIDLHNPESLKAALAQDEQKSIDGSKEEPTRNFLKMSLAVTLFLGALAGLVFFLRKYSKKLQQLPFGKKERLIQVVATHYLGNKKSISIVKVTGEYLVLGISNEGISLITKLGAEANVEKFLEDRFWNGTFERHLDSFAKDQRLTKEVDLDEGPDELLAIPLEQQTKKVTDRVEISSLRANIKEKLSSLKPLN